ncbi:sigma-70 family RNA polymerase sigma factor [Streptomyces sp. NPDC092296]|uniref:sigma-70 family RNA polymerase sigma factor n=1 Tax=Streptomyces sp. NPDC092296 TaxID=3366012 RepID=UPI00381988CA
MTEGPPNGGPEPQGAVPGTAPSQWAELLLAERDSLHRFLTGLAGHDPHHVEDLVQETLLRAWQQADRLDWRDRPIRMWLFRVGRHLLIDGWRKDRAVPVGIAPADFPDPLPSPDHAAQTVDRCLLVESLRALTPLHREAVVHVHLLGRAGADVAHALGVPSGTVKSRTHHGLRALRRQLADRGEAA